MKNLLFILLLVATACFVGCKKDKSCAMEGNWDAKSITVDGVETVGAGINSATIEFEASENNVGDFNIDFLYIDGTSEKLTGEYEVKEGDELRLTYNDGSFEDWDFVVKNNDLTLTGNINGTSMIMKFEKD